MTTEAPASKQRPFCGINAFLEDERTWLQLSQAQRRPELYEAAEVRSGGDSAEVVCSLCSDRATKGSVECDPPHQRLASDTPVPCTVNNSLLV
jgi:hypothetical protein